MSQDNTPPRDGSPREQGEDAVDPAPTAPSGLPPAPWAPPTDGQQPSYPSAYPGQQPNGSEEWQPEQHGDPVKRQRLVIGGIVLGVLVLIGVVIWVLLNLLGTRPEAATTTPSATATPGPLPRDAEAKDFQVGDCFADFDPNASKARAVACDTEHSAQLGAVFTYPADDSFPGTNALRDKGREVCRTVKLNAAADNYVLLQQNVYPSTTSWDRGDRRVDCFIVVDSGNTIKENLLGK
ncbi:septum formation family protein [Paenarthrobacter sp. CAP02]|uniref:septum formation family protein n=1 Tax=Paenarthrobacter sp. CAP02 TaxID=3158144 RepID=UPI0032DBB569